MTKETRIYSAEKSLSSDAGKIGQVHGKKIEHSLTPCKEINSVLIKDLNVRPVNCKTSGGKHGQTL